jgi:hypothetical protein
MNIDRPTERKIICAVERGYGRSESDVGKLRAFYEVLPSNDIVPINVVDEFCVTEMVFVTGQFSELEEKFEERLFEATCKPTDFERRDGDCLYVTRLASCKEIKGALCSEIFDNPLPNISNPVINCKKKPQTKTIILRDNEYLYGPFDFSAEGGAEDYKLHLKAISTPLNNTPQFHIGKIGSQQCIQAIYEKSNLPILLGNIKKCFEQAETIDFITDEQIISTYGSKVAQNSEIRSFNKGTVAQIRKSFSSSVDQRRFPERFKRLFAALDAANNWEGTRKDLVDSFLSTDSGKSVLKSYIEANKDDYFQVEKQEYIKKLDLENKGLTGEINDLIEKRDDVVADIRKSQRERDQMELNAESTASYDALSKKEQEKLESLIEDKKGELDSLSTQVTAYQEKHIRYSTLESVQQEIKDLDRDKERAQTRKTEIDAQVEEVSAKLRQKNDQLTKRLLELKPDVDALSGIAAKSTVKLIDYHVNTAVIDTSKTDDEARDTLIKSVEEALSQQGRKTEYNTVANILTTIAQTQFTLFSGRPGTGKTSLAKLLGTSLGLDKRLLNIPVARGWTSSRDILGFYNALSCSFSSSATGLYELLKHLDLEQKKGVVSAPALCLLDEFNLSQPEHYFSPFLEMSDPESKRIIATGDQDNPYLTVPNYLRFLGTINNDESVQSLTPRMLDRSAIINFDDFEPVYDLAIRPENQSEHLDIIPISGDRFIDLFTARSMELPQDIDRTLKLIIDTLRDDKPELGSPINISFRKIKAIRSYHNVTSSMYIDSRFTALDFAVSQHIIPLLNGYGQNFGKRLTLLIDVIPVEMDRTQKMLYRILEVGNQNMFTYGLNV